MLQNNPNLFIICEFGFWSIMFFLAFSNTAKIRIKDINILWEYYPKRYIMPSRIIRKQFKLPKKEVLILYYLELYLADLFLLFLPIYILIALLSDFNIPLILLIHDSYLVCGFGFAIIIEAITIFYWVKKKKQNKIERRKDNS